MVVGGDCAGRSLRVLPLSHSSGRSGGAGKNPRVTDGSMVRHLSVTRGVSWRQLGSPRLLVDVPRSLRLPHDCQPLKLLEPFGYFSPSRALCLCPCETKGSWNVHIASEYSDCARTV